jgi:hypothetical protein
MKIPITAGIYVDATPGVRVQYPVNMITVPGQDGIDDGHLRPAEGIAAFATGPGNDRGALVLPANHAVGNGTHFRVSGLKLISLSAAGVVTVIDDIPGTDLARMVFSFDRIAIAADGDLYYYDGVTLTQVTDPDLGVVLDVVWVDGYFVFTDGEFVGVTELADPTSVITLKYGSTDNPDPIQCVLKAGNELHVISRHCVDPFRNVGGDGFPFVRVQEGHIPKGAIGERAACVFNEAVAFVGGGLNEAPGVWLGSNAQAVKISSREIDSLLLEYTEAQLATVTLETVVDRGSQLLFVRLPDRTAVYVAEASTPDVPVWCFLTTSLAGFAAYRGANIVRTSDAWILGDPDSSSIGKWVTTDSKHFGGDVRWEFSTPMIRNSGKGAIIHELELVCLPGAGPEGVRPMISTSHTKDGRNWTPDRPISSGDRGDTAKRLRWFREGILQNYRIQRFRGDSSSRLSALQLEARVEGLAF